MREYEQNNTDSGDENYKVVVKNLESREAQLKKTEVRAEEWRDV